MSRAGGNVLPFRTAEAQTDLHGPLDGPVARHLDRMHRGEARRRWMRRAAMLFAWGGVLVGGILFAIVRGMRL
ncbi:hypothetical protein ACVDG3_18130 [Meridianimarinicoccus sp. RP-17]|uniref:hypothetical protein n=1 Tax=Meridianimarinicoccus zhengii TaxID=2056810 RepID=UPI000DAC0A82|nr:hypothetical protein [Phycocomes zhengii]